MCFSYAVLDIISALGSVCGNANDFRVMPFVLLCEESEKPIASHLLMALQWIISAMQEVEITYLRNSRWPRFIF